jgi:hypothetical protein
MYAERTRPCDVCEKPVTKRGPATGKWTCFPCSMAVMTATMRLQMEGAADLRQRAVKEARSALQRVPDRAELGRELAQGRRADRVALGG